MTAIVLQVTEQKLDLQKTTFEGPGPQGLSAYQVAVANGFSGTISEWLDSLKGLTGDAGADGTDGATWTSSSSAPSGGVDGDFHLRTSNWDLYKKVGGSWGVIGNIKGADGANGTNGTNGADGAPGADGTDGATWTSSSSAPSGGADGDFHLRTSNWDLYKKVGGSWGVIGNIKGADGANGTNGTNGADGATWTSSSSAPSGGVDGDFHLRTSNWDLYKKVGGSWSVIGNIKGADGAGANFHTPGKWQYKNDYLVINSDSSFGGVNFQNSSSGTGATVTYENSEPGCQGVVRIHKGTTTTGRGNFWHPKGYNAVCLGTNGVRMWFKFKLGEAVPDATDDYVVRHGFSQNIAGDGTNDIVFIISRTVNSGRLTIRYRSAGVTRFDLDTTITPSTSWQEMYYELDPTTHVITVYDSAGTLLATSAAPATKIASTERFAMSENINGLAGTTNRTFYSDYFITELT